MTFALKRSMLEFFDNDGGQTVQPGVFDVWVAPSAQTGQQISLTLTGL